MRGSGGLRRYPALGFLAVAAALALLLPSKLSSPRSEPASLSEYAPVPGRGDGTGDLSDLGAAGSSGAAASVPGRRPAQERTGAADLRGPGGRGGNLKRCVGSPPRQTEDPLSPPCVAFFDGDNGGATWRGVTRDEVTVVILLVAGTQTTPSGSKTVTAGTVVDYGEPPTLDDPDRDYILKVLVRYFNDRYQTYRRTVRVLGYYGPGGATAETRRTDAAHVDQTLDPFATVPLAGAAFRPYLEAVSERRILGFVYDAYDRSFYRSAAPMVWGILPDLEDHAEITAGYVCDKLAGRRAAFSGNVTDQDRERTFGIAFTDGPSDPAYRVLKDLVRIGLESRCGVRVLEEAGSPDSTQTGQSEAAPKTAAMKAAGVTTVVLIGAPSLSLHYTNAASATGWFPEWFIAGRRSDFTGMDRAANGRLMLTEQWRHAFGFSFSPRWGEPSEQHWRRAYGEACPDCQVRLPYHASAFYDTLQMLFFGIQSAGARLTPQNVDKGLHAIPPRRAPDPFTPASYFTSGGYTAIKDAMEIWWDPSGQASGAGGQPGCFRLPFDGRRFRADEWPSGDEELFRDGPCNGDAPVV